MSERGVVPAPFSRARGTVLRAAPWLALSGTALLALACWLFWPRPDPRGRPTRPGVLAVLVDTSASVARTRPRFVPWVRRELADACAAARGAGREVLVVELDAEVRLRFGPGAPGELEDWLAGRAGEPFAPRPDARRALGTDLAGAVLVASGVLLEPGRAPGSVWLLGDLAATTGSARGLLERLVGRGVDLQSRRPPPVELPDLALERARLPARLAAGAPLAALCELSLTAPAGGSRSDWRALLELELSGPDPRRVELELDLPASGRWSQRVELGRLASGAWTVDVGVRLEERASGRRLDPVPENDRAIGEVWVGGELRCALVSHAPRADWLGRAAPDALVVRASSPRDWPRVAAEVDVLVTVDVGPAELEPLALRRFLEEGGGWLFLGGWGAIRGWSSVGPKDANPSAWLPLVPDPRDDRPRDIVLLVDGSGSMAGEPFERVRRAVFDLVLSASPRDRIELRFFTGALGPVEFESARGQSADQRARAVAGLLDAAVPGGNTDVLYSLETFVDLRRGGEVECLPLLLSDGHTRDPLRERSARLREDMAREQLDLRVLAIGATVDRGFLRTLIASDDAYLEVTPETDLSAVLHRQVNSDRVRRGDLRVLALEPGVLDPQAPERELLEAWSDALTGASLQAHLVGRERPGATVLWRTSGAEPLLALQRVARGWVAALVTAPEAGWAPFLRERPELLEPLLRHLGRDRTPRERRLTVELEERRVVARGLDADAPPALVARFFSAAGALALGGERRALGQALLVPPTGGSDPEGERIGVPPATLAEAPAGAGLEVDLFSEGRLWARSTLRARGSREFSAPALELPRLIGGALGGAPQPAASLAPHPRARQALLLGMVLLALAGVAPVLGQGIGRSRRR